MSDAGNCTAFLQSFANWISQNPQEAKIPHPLFFSGSFCQGSFAPDFNEEMSSQTIPNPFPGNAFGSLYVPPFWQIVLTGIDKNLKRKICSSNQGLLLPLTSGVFFDDPTGVVDCGRTNNPASGSLQNGISLQNNISQIEATLLVPLNPQIPYSSYCWQFDSCNKNIYTNIGSRVVAAFLPGSPECDDLMTFFCKRTDGYTCRVQQQQPINNIDLPECSCVKDEITLQTTYCQPGNSIPECSVQDAFQQYAPVTCLGVNCSQSGYRFKRMQDQKCTVTLCQQLVELLGNSLSVQSESIIFCGNNTSVTVTTTPVLNSSSNTSSIPAYMWAILGVGIFLFFIILPLSIILFRRSIRDEKIDKEKHRRAIEEGIKTEGIDNFLVLANK